VRTGETSRRTIALLCSILDSSELNLCRILILNNEITSEERSRVIFPRLPSRGDEPRGTLSRFHYEVRAFENNTQTPIKLAELENSKINFQRGFRIILCSHRKVGMATDEEFWTRKHETLSFAIRAQPFHATPQATASSSSDESGLLSFQACLAKAASSQTKALEAEKVKKGALIICRVEARGARSRA